MHRVRETDAIRSGAEANLLVHSRTVPLHRCEHDPVDDEEGAEEIVALGPNLTRRS